MNISLDGRQIEVEGKKTILEVAKENGIFIPSLCDYSELSPFSGCRLCLVEIKGRKGYLPSCSTNAEDGMEIISDAPKIKKLRRQILELILSEHPHACLICSEKDQCDEYKSTIKKVGEATGCVLCSNNGRCDLQDVVEVIGVDKVNFPAVYRELEVKKGDPFFDRNYNLCILCGRCVRVCRDIRGASTVTFVYRGPDAVIGTVLDKPLLDSGCQFCGACVDICPTGALTERAIKYDPLPDEKVRTICPLCSMGCALELRLQNGNIISSHSAGDAPVNQGQLCVKGRFTIRNVIKSSKRITNPMIRRNNELEESTWEEALKLLADRLKGYKGKEIGMILSSQSTCEDIFVAHKFALNVLKTNNVDCFETFSPAEEYKAFIQNHGLKDFLNFDIRDIAEAKTIFLTDENIPITHPILWVEILNAVRNGAKFVYAGPFSSIMDRHCTFRLKIKPGSEPYLYGLLSALMLENEKSDSCESIENFEPFQEMLNNLSVSQAKKLIGIEKDDLKKVSELFRGKDPSVIILGSEIFRVRNKESVLAGAWNFSLVSNSQILSLSLLNNEKGFYAVREGSGEKWQEKKKILQAVSEGEIKALYLNGPVPQQKNLNPEFLVVQGSYWNELAEKADIVLPAATCAETDGIFVNVEGRVQYFTNSIKPLAEAKPDWFVWVEIAKKMGSKEFEYKKSTVITKEILKSLPGFTNISFASLENGEKFFIQDECAGKKSFIIESSLDQYPGPGKEYPFRLYMAPFVDAYKDLILAKEMKGFKRIRDPEGIKIHPEDAESSGFKDGEEVTLITENGRMKGRLKISDDIPVGIIAAVLKWGEQSDIQDVSVSMGLLPAKIERG